MYALVGRYEKVRIWSPRSLGPSMVLDKRHNTLRRYRAEDWCYLWPEHTWVPAVAGCAGMSGNQVMRTILGYSGTYGAGTPNNIALSNAYTYNSAGNAIGARLVLGPTETIQSVYFFISSYTGTAANVNDIDVEFRNETSSKPGSTLHFSGQVNPSSATGWVGLTGQSFATSADTAYWPSIADADGNATDFANVLRDVSSAHSVHPDLADKQSANSTAGWSGTPTYNARPATIVIGCASGQSYGSPFSASTNSTSDTNRRGFYFSTGFTEDIDILGMTASLASGISGIEAWEAGTGPSGSPYATGAVPLYGGSGSTTVSGRRFSSPVRLTGGTGYRVVFTYGSAATSPQKLSIGSGANATLRAALPAGGAVYWAGANGTTNWANDDTDGYPQVGLIIVDQVAIAGGGVGLIGQLVVMP